VLYTWYSALTGSDEVTTARRSAIFSRLIGAISQSQRCRLSLMRVDYLEII
jgi:hypothetical protein